VSDPANRIAARVRRADFDLDVDVAWNERVAVIFGPSGSGKSTLLEVVLGLHAGAKPRVRIAGSDLDDPGSELATPVWRRGIGWVPQEPSLFPHLGVDANLRFGLARAGPEGAEHLARARQVLEIDALGDRRIDQLSGGERQRVAIARALASGPRALLLDEPLASLDLPLRARVLPYLLRVREELDLPILYITHDPDEALLVGDVVLVLDGGRVVASGPPAEVLWSRAVLPLSEALGMENVIEATVRECADDTATVETAGGLRLSVPSPTRLERGERLRLGLRAQDILLAADPPGRISARNVLPAVVARSETAPDGVLVHVVPATDLPPEGLTRLDAGDALVAKVTTEAARALALAPGTRIHVVVKAQALRRLA
jgi:molybdate transport system ATP-binding protein